MKAGGLVVVMSESVCFVERAELVVGFRGSFIVMLNRDQKKRKKEKQYQKYRLKRLDIVYNVSLRLMGVFKQLEYNGFVIMSSDQELGCFGIKYKIE